MLWVLNAISLRADEPEKSLELGVSLSKKEIVQFEPVVLDVSVTNRSKKPQQVVGTWDLDWLYLKISVTDSTGKDVFHRINGAVADGIPSKVIIAAGPRDNSLHHRIVLTASPGTWMDKPGDYKLQATFDYGNKKAKPLKSNTVNLAIKPAQGIDKQALTRFRGYPQAKFLAMSTNAAVVGEEFEAVIKKYPKSVYTPWCYYILGWAWQDYDRIPERQRALAAQEYFGELLRKYPKFPLKIEAEYELARALYRLGEREKALKQIDDLAGKHSDLLLFRNVNRSLEWYRDNGKEIPVEELPPHYPQ